MKVKRLVKQRGLGGFPHERLHQAVRAASPTGEGWMNRGLKQNVFNHGDKEKFSLFETPDLITWGILTSGF